MAEVMVVKKPRTGVMVTSAALVAGGAALIFYAVTRSKYGPKGGLKPGEKLGNLVAGGLDDTGILTVPIGVMIPALQPSVLYAGPGRDAYTHFRIVQQQGADLVTVYGSGVAGVHIGPAATLQEFPLVSPSQIEPEGCPIQTLCAYPWPGPAPTPICGAPPVPGAADALLEIYEIARPQDADGYSSPTCGSAAVAIPRIPVMRKVYPRKVVFI